MKQITVYLYICILLFAGISCSGEDNQSEDENIRVEGFAAQLGDRETESPGSRAIGDFAVNTAADPTFDKTRLTGTGGWILDVKLLNKNNQETPAGTASCTYNGTAWIPSTTLYFASYHSPQIHARLAPSGWTAINTNQATSANLLLQDILVERSSPYSVRPSHNPTLVLRHGNTMLDFILSDVNPAEIVSVDVVAGGQTYQPYQVTGRTAPEYLVILPVGTSNPVVRINTTSGARYQETIKISPMAINNCYCAKLIGVELILSSVTVIDWIYGTALEGSYTTVTSYPTFRGNPNTSATVYYDNGLSQLLEFDDRGESTIKPTGRTIVRINNNVLDTPLILGTMYIDLRPYL